MEGIAGPAGPLADQFEDGLRLLAASLALKGDHRSAAGAISSGCGAIRCFLKILEAAAGRHLPDPEGNVERLRSQCAALLTLGQDPEDALEHTLEAARLARDEAARILVQLGMPRELS